ncbi:hypothetical protein HY571_02725 [Candidatus Micrarchaeota archaeon]|nr:hypothetical protein [Candidatus Micrarchaeota archaeon]
MHVPDLNKFNKLFDEAAALLNQAKNRPVKIRYDGDADGVLSALILKKTFNPLSLRFQQSGGAVYEEKDADEDANLPENTLLILLDHGANLQSRANLCRTAEKGRIEIMAIDHHPPAENHCIKHLVSPFAVKCKEPSSYNTGLLCFEIAKRLSPGIEKQLLPLCLYSMQADTSSFRSKEFFPEAVVVDYLAKRSKEPYGLEFYDKILKDKHLILELFREEQAIIKNALSRALKKCKAKQGKYAVISCKVTGISKSRGYPPIGKLHNAVQSHFAEKGPTASLLYTNNKLSFRATHSAAELGFSANRVINALNETYEKHGFTGGGHDVAASTRFPKEYGKEIVEKAKQMVMQNAGIDSTVI